LPHSEKINFPVTFLPLGVVYVAQSQRAMSVLGVSSGGSSGCISYSELLAFGDEQLAAETQAENTDAFAVIFRRYHRLIHLVALRVLRDAGETEDLTQTVFLEIYRKMGQFDPARGTLKVWLLQLARLWGTAKYLIVPRSRTHLGFAIGFALWARCRI
jgi:hypothetical protein